MRDLNILISGCSFTGQGFDKIDSVTWVQPLTKSHNITNLGVPSVSNEYIADSIINYLLDNDSTDLVLVMWSGLQRQDFIIDPLIEDDYSMHRLTMYDGIRYSPGGADLDRPSSATAMAKKEMFKIGTEQGFAWRGLLQIIKLEHFLKARGMPYLFMSYVNYWNDQDIVANSNVGVYKYPSLTKLANQIDFDHWIFSNAAKDGYYELAKELNSFFPDNFHPAHKAIDAWASIVETRIRDIQINLN